MSDSRNAGGHGGVPILVESTDKLRLEHWQRHTSSVSAEVLRALGWLTPERRVLVQDALGVRQVPGDKVETDLIFLRPKDAVTKERWSFLLQLGHRRIELRRMAEGHIESLTAEVAEAKKALGEASARLAQEDRRAASARKGLATRAERLASEAHRLEVDARAEAGRDEIGPATRGLQKRLSGLDSLRVRMLREETAREPFAREVARLEAMIRSLELKKREWELWQQPRRLPGVSGWIGAFLTEEQMNVATHAMEELSRDPRPRVRLANELDQRLGNDEALLGR